MDIVFLLRHILLDGLENGETVDKLPLVKNSPLEEMQMEKTV